MTLAEWSVDGNITAEIPIPIEIGSCLATGLVLQSMPLTALVFITQVPSSTETDFPSYKPTPDCPFFASDFTYTLTGKDKPDWIFLDDARKKIVLEPTDTSLVTGGYDLEFKTEFKGLEVKSTMQVILNVQAEVEEIEEDLIESEVEEVVPEVAWDGWKALLSDNPNYREPVPNSDPNYVPTPPKVAQTEISVKGDVTLKFNEDVWIVDDLKNATFSRYVGPSRELQQFEEVPYIDIYIEPGDDTLPTFDPDKLKFDYDAEFTDARSIKISVRFETPMYVSAS